MVNKKGSILMGQPTTGELAIRVDGHRDRLNKNDEEHKDLWDGQNRIQNRLPNWATLFIAVLTMIVGALLRGIL